MDESNTSSTPVVETPVTVAPVIAIETPVVAPVIEQVKETPVITPVTEIPKVETTKPAETILGSELDKTKPTPVEAPKVDNTSVEKAAPETEVKPIEGGQSDEPAPPPSYEAFKVPEGFTLDKERSDKFTALLSDLELTGKASHDVVQQFGQKAIDFHTNEVKQAVENTTKYYQTVWDKQKTGWKDSVLKDPELGGNRIQTTVDSALSFIRTHGGTADQQNEFRDLMESSGLGNHPAILRLLANAGRAMSEGKPLAASRPVQQTQSKVKTLYSKSQ